VNGRACRRRRVSDPPASKGANRRLMNDRFADRRPKAVRMRQLVAATRRAAEETGSSRTAAAFVGICLVPLLSGCIVGGERPDPAVAVPPAYRRSSPAPAHPAVPGLDWWRGFRSPEL